MASGRKTRLADGGRRGPAEARRQAVLAHGPVVVEPQQFDHVPDVGLTFDPTRRGSLPAWKNRMVRNPPLVEEIGPDLLGE